MTGQSASRAFLALLCLGLCLAALYALAVAAGAEPAPPFITALASAKLVAVVLAALVAVTAAAAAARALTAPTQDKPDAGSGTTAWLLPTMLLFLFAAYLAAAKTQQPRLFVMALSLPAGAAAVLTGRYTAWLLERDREERLELRHDILGVGGGLGGWRISRSLGAALLAIMLGAAAFTLALAGLPTDKQGGKTETGDQKTSGADPKPPETKSK